MTLTGSLRVNFEGPALHVFPSIHPDPFDRALIGQAIAEDLTLLTTDATISRYASDTFRVIR